MYDKTDVQCLLQISKTEAMCSIRSLCDQLIGEVDFLIVFELILPILNIQDSFIAIRVVEFTGQSVNTSA